MRRRSVKPAGSPRADSRSGLASLTLPVTAPPAGLPVDERPFEEHRRTQERRLSGQCRVIPPPTAIVATVGDARAFDSGRSFAAWLGLTPRQQSTGGRERLLGISKRGDGYLRRQLMHGARSIVRLATGRGGKLWGWINGLLARRSFNIVVAALANKLARIIWAMLVRGETYRAAA